MTELTSLDPPVTEMRTQQIKRLEKVSEPTWDKIVINLPVRISSRVQLTEQIRELSHWADEDPTNRWAQVKQVLDNLGVSIPNSAAQEEPTEIPFIIVAMTKDEAEKLFNESVFNNETVAPAEKDYFTDFIQALREQLITDEEKGNLAEMNITQQEKEQRLKQIEQRIRDNLKECYGELRENWKPYNYKKEDEKPPQTIKQIIDSETTDGIRAKFYSLDQLERGQDDEFKKAKIYIVILDSISCYHPGLRKKFTSNLVGLDGRLALLITSAVKPSQIPVHKMIQKYLKDEIRQFFNRYFSKDKLVNFGVLEDIDCQRWIKIIMPDVIDTLKGKKADDSQKEKVEQWKGENKVPNRLSY